MVTLSSTKEARIYNGKKTTSLTSGAGKTGQLCLKIMKLVHFLTSYTKNKVKMDWKPKCKTRNYKTPRGEHRQNTLRHKSQQDPLRPTSQNIRNKSKNKQILETKAKINKIKAKIKSKTKAKINK